MINIRKSARAAAAAGAMIGVAVISTTLGATTASAMDDVVRSESATPTWISSGIFGYSSSAGDWVLYDRYRLPNNQIQTRCHYASTTRAPWNC